MLNNISLSNGVDILTMPASYRSIRGVTAIAVLADEIAYWFSEEDSRNPDSEILAAVRPALSTTGGSPLSCSRITSLIPIIPIGIRLTQHTRR